MHRFGHIENGIMNLNEYGIIARNQWMQTSQLRPNIELGAFVIMPNHIHGIIHITHTGIDVLHTHISNTPKKKGECNSPQPDTNSRTGVLNTSNNNHGAFHSPKQTIGAIVRGYKGAVTKQLEVLGMTEKLWQRNYYEHIIRNHQSYQTIEDYILSNPSRWKEDKFYI